jgi:predicted GNAT family acetyltransferase
MELRESTLLSVYQLEPARFQRIINVLVQQFRGADGTPRFQIESQGKVAAISGTNWRSPTFAEVFVVVDPGSRHRGWGKSVASACTSALLEDRLRPLYFVAEGNRQSVRIAEELGYLDTGLREVAAEGRLK